MVACSFEITFDKEKGFYLLFCFFFHPDGLWGICLPQAPEVVGSSPD